MTRPPALAIDNLTVEYPLADGGVFTAVEGVSLSIAPGEIHALVGESGAGKTTIGNAAMGLLEAPGRIAAGSIAIAGLALDPATGRTAGIVPGRDIGATVTLHFAREGKASQTQVVLGELPNEDAQRPEQGGRIGLALQTLTPDVADSQARRIDWVSIASRSM